MPSAGEMCDRYTFQEVQPATVVDGIDRAGVWGGDVTVAAKTQFLYGTEAVQSARLQGKQPVVLTIRRSSATKVIDSSWRALDARDTGRVFNITAVEPTADRAFLQVLATLEQGQSNNG